MVLMDEIQKAQVLQSQLEHERVHFMMNEIALAMSFLNLADTTRSEETRERKPRQRAQGARHGGGIF